MHTLATKNSLYRRRLARQAESLRYWLEMGEVPLNTEKDVREAITALESALLENERRWF